MNDRLKPASRILFTSALVLAGLACQDRQTERSEQHGSSTLHLANLLEEAVVERSGPLPDAQQERRWTFAEPLPEWRVLSQEQYQYLGQAKLKQLSDAVRLDLTQPGTFRSGGLQIDLDGLRLDDWETVVVQARTSDRFAGVTAIANLKDVAGLPGVELFFSSPDLAPPLFNDGSTQNYAIPLRLKQAEDDAPLQSLAILFAAPGPVQVDILSVTLVPQGAGYVEAVGVRQISRQGLTRHTLYAHAPASIVYQVDLPPGGRLDFGLTVDKDEVVTYRVAAEHAGQQPLRFEETIAEPGEWQQRSVDLSGLAPGVVKLTLEVASDQPRAVGLWGAPILSGSSATDLPNVIFYVIDGGGADLMSLYEYERSTTPFLEELAQEGVLFTRAHSNATWTQPSTVSFMTSLQHSVLGGLRRGIHSTKVPAAAVTMAEHFRRAGFLTASLTSNPNAGRMVGTDRGVDLMRDVETEHHSTSSLELHERFFELRENYPAEPFWVHFQTTDVHEPNQPVAPFAGQFTNPEAIAKLKEWDQAIWRFAGDVFGTTSIQGFYDEALKRAGIDRKEFFGTRRDLYDETMAHQDDALRRLVERLKAEGEWERTLLVIGADHGHPAGTFARFGRGLFDPQPEPWQGAMFDAYATRVPLLIIWPGKIEGGRRINEPVSMIDVLPTLLELAGLPEPEVVQGQSLAPLLLGESTELRPVILDEFRVDEETGELIGNLEIIDGRWGASLEIGPVAQGADPSRGRHSVPAGGRWGAVHPHFPEIPRLLLYDLEADPFAKQAVNDAHPDLVRRYTSQLLDLWQVHRALSQRYNEIEDATMTPEQLEQLRQLGYIR